MKPTLLSLGSFHLYSFGVMVAAGVLLATWLLCRRARSSDFINSEQVVDLIFVIVVAGFVGGRSFYVIQNWKWYREVPLRILAFWEGGLIFYGGLLFAVLAVIGFTRMKKIPTFKFLDFMIPYVALAHAFGRIGCFLNGCCGGKICHLPWAVHFPGQACLECDPVCRFSRHRVISGQLKGCLSFDR